MREDKKRGEGGGVATCTTMNDHLKIFLKLQIDPLEF